MKIFLQEPIKNVSQEVISVVKKLFHNSLHKGVLSKVEIRKGIKNSEISVKLFDNFC